MVWTRFKIIENRLFGMKLQTLNVAMTSNYYCNKFVKSRNVGFLFDWNNMLVVMEVEDRLIVSECTNFEKEYLGHTKACRAYAARTH